MFSHIPYLISPPPPFTLKPRPEICFQPPNVWHEYQDRIIENLDIGVYTHSWDNSCIYVFLYFKSTPKWMGTNIRIKWKMLGCTHIPEISFSPFPPSLLNRGRRALRQQLYFFISVFWIPLPPKMFGTNIRMEWKMLGCSHILEIVLSPCPMHS